MKNISGMFENCAFQGDLSRWDVSGINNFSCMFRRTSYAGDLSGWKFKNTADVSRMISKECTVKMPLDWPSSRVETLFPNQAHLKDWFVHAQYKGLAAWEKAQTKSRPPWWSKEEFKTLQRVRDTLLQLGADPKMVVAQSWQQWHETTQNPIEALEEPFDFSMT